MLQLDNFVLSGAQSTRMFPSHAVQSIPCRGYCVHQHELVACRIHLARCQLAVRLSPTDIAKASSLRRLQLVLLAPSSNCCHRTPATATAS